jgi:hypothetical protein
MTLVVIAWSYVVLMLALVEALRPSGSVLGAIVTVLLYGVLPLAVLIYISGAPARRRAARAAEAAGNAPSDGVDPGRGGQPPAQAVAPEREEP